MLLSLILGSLAGLSLLLLLWQWALARGFPLHRRVEHVSFAPPVTLLKSLKGCDEATEACLRSWFEQHYTGPVQILFGVASAEDPVCGVVRKLIGEYPGCDVELMICSPLVGSNLKVAKLVWLEAAARHEIVVISDADVKVPPDFLGNVVAPLQTPQVGLVNCFYELANPSTWAMHWEAVAINSDFWSQVLQSRSLKPLDFALGAVMVTRRELLAGIGGFQSLSNCLADDYQLGQRIARQNYRIEICPVTVQCWSGSMTFRQVWKHQLRWARTIRVCQPVPYFFSILSNATFWPSVWALVQPGLMSGSFALACLLVRMLVARDLQQHLTRSSLPLSSLPVAIIKDILQTGLWLLAFAGNRIEWRGEIMRLKRDGTLVKG